jgi:hypothetical protein
MFGQNLRCRETTLLFPAEQHLLFPGEKPNFQQYTITALCVGKHPDLSTWGGKQPPEGWQIWMFPYTEGRNCIIIFLPMCYRLSPLWGEIGLFGGEQ